MPIIKDVREGCFGVIEEEQHVQKRVQISATTVVHSIDSMTDMTDSEKSKLWWQKSDYRRFKQTASILAQARPWQDREISMLKEDSSVCGAKPTSASCIWRAHYHELAGDITPRNAAGQYSTDAWWLQYGHSRRGLEHITSMENGRQRFRLAKAARSAVLDEQRRQSAVGRAEPTKLRAVSQEHTSWARDLALIRAASDAEAAQSEYDCKPEIRLIKNKNLVGSDINEQTGEHYGADGTLSVTVGKYSQEIQLKGKGCAASPSAGNTDPLLLCGRNKNVIGFGGSEVNITALLNGTGPNSNKSGHSTPLRCSLRKRLPPEGMRWCDI